MPDLVAVRRIDIPSSAPPYDDEPKTAMTPALKSPSRPADTGPDKPDSGPSDPDPQVPGQGGWPSQFAQVLAETLAGSRPARQLSPWTTEQTRQRIRQLGPLLATGQRPRVRRIMTSAPRQDVLEMTAVVGFGPRVRVLAVRLEQADEASDHWRCTAIESA